MPFSQAVSLVTQNFHSGLIPQVTQILIAISPIVLAVFLFVIMWDLWVDYVRSKNFLSLKYTVLELRLPKETNKSPLAMEPILHGLHNTADGGNYSQYWKGETRPWYSLELVSIGGQVKFFVWTEDRRKAGLMGTLYAQFPGIEIIEREDYAKSVHFDKDKIRIWAAEFKFTKDDPYPIKTYVDYGLERDPKEEFKVDPLLQVIEHLGNVKPNQQMWFQFLIRAHKDDQKDPKKLMAFKKVDLFKIKSVEIVDEIMVRNKIKDEDYKDMKIAGKLTKEGRLVFPTLSKGEQETVAAIERKGLKLLFDVGIRGLYICPKDSFDGPFGVGGLISSMKQFSTEGYNGLRPNGDKWHVQFDGVPWEDYRNFRRDRQSRLALMAYKLRSYFYTPFPSKSLVLNTEELATMWHFPGSVAATPGLDRVPSKRSEAPINLPT